jgi:hypothetical protein
MSKKPPKDFNAFAEPLEGVLKFGWIEWKSHTWGYTLLRSKRQTETLLR